MALEGGDADIERRGRGERLTQAAAAAETWTAIRYAVVGMFVTIVYVGLAIVLERSTHIGGQSASWIGLTASASVGYVGHRTVTFRSSDGHAYTAPRYIALVLNGYVVSYIVIHVLVGWHLTSFRVATVTVAGTIAAISYLFNRLLIFRTTSPAP